MHSAPTQRDSCSLRLSAPSADAMPSGRAFAAAVPELMGWLGADGFLLAGRRFMCRVKSHAHERATGHGARVPQNGAWGLCEQRSCTHPVVAPTGSWGCSRELVGLRSREQRGPVANLCSACISRPYDLDLFCLLEKKQFSNIIRCGLVGCRKEDTSSSKGVPDPTSSTPKP